MQVKPGFVTPQVALITTVPPVSQRGARRVTAAPKGTVMLSNLHPSDAVAVTLPHTQYGGMSSKLHCADEQEKPGFVIEHALPMATLPPATQSPCAVAAIPAARARESNVQRAAWRQKCGLCVRYSDRGV